ncbi:6-carboxytetrahydropterin synthase [Streptomyces sp. NPDC001604]|uniref:6-carboxytetrahydropterin synthase n=1 Tax=Streptomyces sp. NPDC001604 TaxID=3364593 RepID=UPI0036CF0567
MMTLTREGDFAAVHTQQTLPSWHLCHHPHQHQWTVQLEVVAEDNLTDDESAKVHTAFAQFDAWIDEHLHLQYLNTLDDSLAMDCGAWQLGKWIYATWAGRVPHLAAVHVQGPTRDHPTDPSPRPNERYVVTYRPEDDPSYGRYQLANDDIQVAEVDVSWQESWWGPKGARTVEMVKHVTVRFAEGHHPYTRWRLDNVLSESTAPDDQLLYVESLTIEYRYAAERTLYGSRLPAEWWACGTDAKTVHAHESGQVIEPRREQNLYTLGSADIPAWLQSLQQTYLPGPHEVPPAPPSAVHS